MRKTQGGRVLCRWRGLPPRCGKAIKLINLDNQRRNLRAAEWWPCPEESPWLDLARQSCRHSAPSIGAGGAKAQVESVGAGGEESGMGRKQLSSPEGPGFPHLCFSLSLPPSPRPHLS